MSSFSLKHIVREPAREGRAPLLVLLHGLRSNEHDLIQLSPLLDERFFIASAQAPVTMGPAAYAWYEVEFVPEGYIINVEQAACSVDLILRFVDELKGSYDVDPARVFLMGFSQGAAMSVSAALTEPRSFAGVVAMSGRLVEETSVKFARSEEIAGLPIMAVHGTRDSVIPIGDGRAMRDALARMPVDLKYREYEMAHEVTERSIRDIAAWLTERLDSVHDWRTASAG